MIDEVRGELRAFLRQKLEQKLPLGIGADMITDYVMANFAASGFIASRAFP